jgi:7-carboxy-7-deazaguanine synthase
MNTQQPQKPTHQNDGALQVYSIFHTIQGEGPFTGHRAVFIRLAGCNLVCPQCDTDYTVPEDDSLLAPEEVVEDVLALINEADPEWAGESLNENEKYLVVITGGEPYRQNLKPLVELLILNRMFVQIETNGTLYQDLPYMDMAVVCSPKTGSINKQLAPHISALKYVVTAGKVLDFDGLPLSALDHPCGDILARPPERFQGIIYLQPADEKDEEKNQANLQVAVNSVLKFGYVLQLQTHKIIGLD